MASRNMPVRDELVLNIDVVFPMLKSGEGIPVLKHTKRGQSDPRRLRLDTDDSTLEIFRQSTTSFLNRKMSNRTYYLKTLEEVGPATSVPGGQGGKAATPGRTLVFVFRNRSLFVTVETRELCAALVALFRPAGTGGGQAPHPAAAAPLTNVSGFSGSGAITAHPSEDGDSASLTAPASASSSGAAASRRHASPSSPSSDGQSVWGAWRAAAAAPRRVSENAASARSGENRSRMSSAVSERQLGGWGGDENDILGVLGGGGGSSYVASRSRGGAQRARARGNRRGVGRTLEGRLKRSASETAGAEIFDVDAVSTSSSDEEGEEARAAGVTAAAAAAVAAGSSWERSQQRSPQRSSESPDAIMRARMVGFGSADLGTEGNPRPKRAGRTSSIRPRWPARFTDSSEKKGMAAAATTAGRLKTTGLAVEDSADLEEDTWVTTTEGTAGVAELRGTGDVRPTTSPRGDHHGGPSPLAVRDEDRLNLESLRRPASAPSNVLRTEAPESSSSSFQDTPPAQHGVKPRTAARVSSPPERHDRMSPPLARGRASAPPLQQATTTSAAAPLQNKGGEFEFAFSRRPEPPQPPPARAVEAQPPQTLPLQERKEPIAVDEAFVMEKRILPLPRPGVADPTRLQQLGLTAKAAATVTTTAAVVGVHTPDAGILRDTRHERSLSPSPQQPPQHVVAVTRNAVTAAVATNGARASAGAGAGAGVDRRRERGSLENRRYNRSSSLDSLEAEDPDHRHVHRPLNFGASASFSEDDLMSGGGQRNEHVAAAGVEEVSPPDLRHGQPGSGGAPAPGRSRLRDSEDGHGVIPTFGNKAEPAAMSYTSRDLPFLDERHASVGEEMGRASAPVAAAAGGSGGGEEAATRKTERISGMDRLESFATSRTDSFGPPTRDEAALSKLTIQTALSHDEYAAPSEAGTTRRSDSSSLPFATTPRSAAARGGLNNGRGSRDRRGSYDRRGSGGTDCTSPGSPPGGADGEVRASLLPHPMGTRAIPMISGLHLGGGALRDQRPQGPSGFEELWAVLEPEWDINSSFGASFAPKVMLLSDIYGNLRSFQEAVASVCVRACGPVLAEVCGRCARAWAVLISTSVQDMVDCKDTLSTIQFGILQLIDVVRRYEASAVVRRFTLPLIGVGTAWEEILAAGEGGDLQEPCLRIEEAISQLPEKERDGGGKRRSSGGGGGGSGRRRQSLGPTELRLPPCPSYWAKGQFDQLTPNRLADIATLLHEPARFAELAELVTRASDVGPQNREYSEAWNCVRRVEGPALGRELRRALSATLVAAGELRPLPRVPPPPPAYVPREQLTQQIKAAILHPFLPLRIAGIGGASGSGKTVLAAAVVRDASVRSRFGDRVFWLHAGKGASHRLVSLLQDLADTVFAWLTDGNQGASPCGSSSSSSQRRRAGSGGGQPGGDAAGGGFADPSLREPVRFRDQDQAVNYVADLCRGPSLAGLRCLVVLDDVHEREVVDALWKSGCQLLVTSPVDGLLQVVGAEATMAAPLEPDVAKEVARRASGEAMFCAEASRLVNLCRGCPLALSMSGAIAQAVLSGGNDAREYRKPWLPTPRTTGSDSTGGGKAAGPTGGGSWSLSDLTAPVGAWVEQVVVGTSGSPPTNRQRASTASSSERKRRPATVPEGDIHANEGDDGAVDKKGAGEAGGPRRGPEATAWANLTCRVDAALKKLQQSRTLRGLLAEAGPEQGMPVRELVAVLTELAIQEADRILGRSGWALECYLSFALLPEGLPLPPPALEEFWRSGGDGQGGREGAGGHNGYANGGGGCGGSGFAESRHLRPPTPVEVFEALRMVGRAGGGEGADGLLPHGLQRTMVLCMVQRYPDTMQKMVRRRVEMLSRISSLVGTFDDSFWGLGRVGGAEVGVETARSGGAGEVVDMIPSRLLGSRRPGPPSHGYGGFSRYDYLLASWNALPQPHTIASAAARYASSVRAACQAAAAEAASGAVGAAATLDGGGAARTGGDASAARGGWATARALASVADIQALADARPEAIRTYGEACALLAAEAAKTAKVEGVPQKERAARDEHHKVASKMQELAVLAAQLGKEAPAIRLLQRAVEMHLSALEASGVLVPRFGGVNEHRAKLGKPDAEAVAAAAAAAEEARGRGAGITYRAIVEDARPIASRLWLQSSAGVGQHPTSGRGGGSGGGGGGGNLSDFGRLDVVGTCVGDLGLVLECIRTLQQKEKVEHSIQLAEKVYPVLKEILGADHAFTKTALAAFVGQGIVDECWSHPDVEGSGGPALPSPTSRRRLARSSAGGRVVSGSAAGIGAGILGGRSGGGRGGSAAQYATGSSSNPLVVLTHSDLSVPPSPLPEEFYARYSTSVNCEPNGGVGHGANGGDASGGGGGGGGGGIHRDGGLSNNDSISSGTEGDDGDDSDGGGAIGSRRGGPINRGGAFQRRTSHGRRHGEAAAATAATAKGGGGGDKGAGEGGTLEPARSLMQQECYVQHLRRRARAHAFLITAATRARLNKETRDEASLFLMERARQQQVAAGLPPDESSMAAGLSPDGTAQMARLIMTRR